MGQAHLDAAATAVPPPKIRSIGSEAEAKALAGWLALPGRRWPVVVVTVPAGQEEPFADPEKIKEDVGDLAEVVVMPTGDISWAFSIAMPQMTQVYGGAGRVYPVDHHWVSKPSRSRLRFAYSPQDRARITEHLINDALEAALTAGLLESRSAPGARVRRGEVLGVIGSRAVVTLDDAALATVWEELTLPGVPLDRLLVKGQSVTGSHDPVSMRLDLRQELRGILAADAAVAVTRAYRIGDVVLADVAAVTDESVTVRLLPGLPVEAPREAVTSNPRDSLTGLFTIGEVIACRLVGADPPVLRLDDVDDEETPKPAPSLLPGGPPWLRLSEPEPPRPPALDQPRAPVLAPRTPAVPAPGPAGTLATGQVGAPAPGQVRGTRARTGGGASAGPVGTFSAGPEATPATGPLATPSRLPSPLDLARRSGAVAPKPQAGQQALRAGRRPRRGVGPAADPARAARQRLAAERATRKALADELAGLRARAADLEDELDRARQIIEGLQTRYRSADLKRQQAAAKLRSLQGRAEPVDESTLFLDPEEQFRYEVLREWAQRVPAAEKAGKPLAAYRLAPGFLEASTQVEGASRAKVVSVVVEVLTDQAKHIAGRDLHQLRAGEAGSPTYGGPPTARPAGGSRSSGSRPRPAGCTTGAPPTGTSSRGWSCTTTSGPDAGGVSRAGAPGGQTELGAYTGGVVHQWRPLRRGQPGRGDQVVLQRQQLCPVQRPARVAAGQEERAAVRVDVQTPPGGEEVLQRARLGNRFAHAQRQPAGRRPGAPPCAVAQHVTLAGQTHRRPDVRQAQSGLGDEDRQQPFGVHRQEDHAAAALVVDAVEPDVGFAEGAEVGQGHAHAGGGPGDPERHQADVGDAVEDVGTYPGGQEPGDAARRHGPVHEGDVLPAHAQHRRTAGARQGRGSQVRGVLRRRSQLHHRRIHAVVQFQRSTRAPPNRRRGRTGGRT